MHIANRLKRKLVLLINPESWYPVSYTIKQNGEKVNETSVLQGKDLTENQIIELWKLDLLEPLNV